MDSFFDRRPSGNYDMNVSLLPVLSAVALGTKTRTTHHLLPFLSVKTVIF